jgi:hypothetical protein
MPIKCYNKPNRKKPRVYTARDVGRIVAYARNDGASDTLLIAYILQSFGVRKLQCIIYKILDILNIGVFLGAMIILLKGIVYLIKGLRLLGTGKRGIALDLITILTPKKYLGELGLFFLWTGAVESVIGIAIIFLTSMGNNLALYSLAQGVCEAEVVELNVQVSQIDLGDLGSKLDEVRELLSSLEKDSRSL